MQKKKIVDEYFAVLSDYNSVFNYYLKTLGFCVFVNFGFIV